jgi:hypothetical protein
MGRMRAVQEGETIMERGRLSIPPPQVIEMIEDSNRSVL